MKKMKQKIEKQKKKNLGFKLALIPYHKCKVKVKNKMEQSWIESVIILH
jgi:hypothetical protein